MTIGEKVKSANPRHYRVSPSNMVLVQGPALYIKEAPQYGLYAKGGNNSMPTLVSCAGALDVGHHRPYLVPALIGY